MAHSFVNAPPRLRRRPWQGVGTTFNNPHSTAIEALQCAGLAWRVDKRKVSGSIYHIVREDTEEILGVVGSYFEPLQHIDAFHAADVLCEKRGARYVAAGFHDARVWLIVELSSFVALGEDDAIEEYLLLSVGHDGAKPLECLHMPVRIINQAVLLNDSAHKVHHFSKAAELVRSDWFRAIPFAYAAHEVLEGRVRKLKRYVPKEAEVMEVLTALFAKASQTLGAGETARKVEAVRRLFLRGDANVRANDNYSLYALYSAIVEYCDYERSVRRGPEETQDEARFDSMMFSYGRKAKESALDMIMRLCQ